MKLLPIKLCAMASAVLVATTARADIASVNYVHKYVTKVWDITIPHNSADSNVVSMKYLMSLVDAANAELNGTPTEYAADPSRATSNIASTSAAKSAIDNLIKKDVEPDPHEGEYKFFFTPATTNNEYHFSISAAGTYYINWGDGQFETKEKNSVGSEYITHTYAKAANTYNISLGGKATAYSSVFDVATVSFSSGRFSEYDMGLSKMSGCLGCIFSTIGEGGEGKQPIFYWTFVYNDKLTGTIPEELFNGITGAPVEAMFFYTFGYTGLSGQIPAGLFAGIKGAPAPFVFGGTFAECPGLTGSIPEGLFAGLKGATQKLMYYRTFSNCTGLTGDIPSDLFAGISTTDGYATESDGYRGAFSETFLGCVNLTGHSPKIDGKYIYEIWPDIPNQITYSNCTGLSDYACIPTNWGGDGTKNPGECGE